MISVNRMILSNFGIKANNIALVTSCQRNHGKPSIKLSNKYGMDGTTTRFANKVTTSKIAVTQNPSIEKKR